MSVIHIAVILCMRTGPAYEEEFMKMYYPDARNEYGTSVKIIHNGALLCPVSETKL